MSVESARFRTLEARLFARYAESIDAADVPLVFIVASPRTGSTLVYQVLAQGFDVWPFSNLVNDEFAAHPIVGALLDRALRDALDTGAESAASFESAYGKTQGPLGVSEASFVFRQWFGGEQPSQTRSSQVLPGREEHLVASMKALWCVTGKPVLTKNAWNCFRIEAWSRLFANLRFVRVRRDLHASAVSDLEARYRRGSPEHWNSATTADCDDIRKRPYWEQVVEQQVAYNRAMEADFAAHCPGRHIDVWYEDLCARPEEELDRLEQFFAAREPRIRRVGSPSLPAIRASDGPTDMDEDRERIRRYIDEHADDRFRADLYPHDDRSV